MGKGRYNNEMQREYQAGWAKRNTRSNEKRVKTWTRGRGGGVVGLEECVVMGPRKFGEFEEGSAVRPQVGEAPGGKRDINKRQVC